MNKAAGRGSCQLQVVGVDVKEKEDVLSLVADRRTPVGRKSFAAYRNNLLCSRAQLELLYAPRLGSVQISALAVGKNSSFVRSRGQAEWRRVLPGKPVTLFDGDAIQLVAEGPKIVVSITGGRRVVYDRSSKQGGAGTDKPMCIYGLDCKKRDDELHMSSYAHLD